MNDIQQEMVNFCTTMGLTQFKGKVSIDLPSLINDLDAGLNGRTTEEIEYLMTKIHAFNLDLKNKKSSLKAFITIKEQQVNKYVSENLHQVTDMYTPFEFKKELIISKSVTVSQAYKDLLRSKSQLEKIGDIPFSIDKVIASMEVYMRRRYSQ